MQIRRLEKSDLVELFDIHKKFYNFAFPDLSNPLYAIQRVVVNDDKIILAGVVKLTSEIIFITNKNSSPITRMKAIKLAEEKMKEDAIKFGLEDFHIFAENDSNFINILHKLGWEDCTGHAMVKYGK